MAQTTLVRVFTGQLSNQTLQLCSARDLHTFLEVGRDFSNWIKDRIAEYSFIETEDFKLDSPKLANQNRHGGDRRSKDYHITLDMAKELAMIENNERGRQVRRYFIALEKETRAKVGFGGKPAELPAPRCIRKREDLSFTARDAEGLMQNWFVPSRKGQWHEHVGIGEEWFVEVVELAKRNPEEAFNALRFAGAQLVHYWNHGHECGFMTAFARWAVAAMIEHKGQAPVMPFKLPELGIPPRRFDGGHR